VIPLSRRQLGKDAQAITKQFPDLVRIKPSPVTELLKRIKIGKPSRISWHPLRHARRIFTMTGRGVTRRHHQPNFYVSRGGLRTKLEGNSQGKLQGSLTAFVRLLTIIARIRIGKDNKRPYFPLIRQRKSKIFLNEMMKLNPNRAEIERAELLRWAFENGREDILVQFGFYLGLDDPQL